MDFGHKKLYIGGELMEAATADTQDVICPGTEESVANVAWAGQKDAEKALQAAQNGFQEWKELSIEQRTEWMSKLRDAVLQREDELRSAIMYEMGKTYDAAKEDFDIVVNALEWYPQEMQHRREEIIPDVQGTHHHFVTSEPAGVVIAFLAWNFPLLNFGFKVGPALAAGCSIIMKPSASSPLSAYILGEICSEIGLPPGVINILTGSNSEVSNTLAASEIPRVATMIGSSGSGKRLIANCTTTIKKSSMELGGNAPLLMFPDGDLETATDIINAIKFGGNAGQVCVAPDRMFVHKDVVEEFTHILTSKASQAKIAFGRELEPTLGALISSKACNTMQEMVDDALEKGADLVCGGKQPEHIEKGHFYEPTVLTNCTSEMRVFYEEIFGPVVPIITFEDEDEALELANKTEHGLASFVFTKDLNRASRISKRLEFGEVQVNGVKYCIYLPHGGIKESGIGHDCSHLALEDYLVKKRVSVQL